MLGDAVDPSEDQQNQERRQIDERRGQQSPRGAFVATEIKLHDDSTAATIVEVFTLDRVGVLYAITQTLAELGLDISLAKVSTEGEKVADVFYRTKPHPQAPKLAPDDNGLIWLPEAAFATAFAPNASAEDRAVLAAVQRPISLSCITVPVGRPLWKDVPSWFLVAEEDRMIVSETQRYMAERMKARTEAHAVDHTPSVTAPEAVVGMIREAIRSVIGA